MALYESEELWREVIGRAGVTLITLPIVFGFFALSAALLGGRVVLGLVRGRRSFEPLLP